MPYAENYHSLKKNPQTTPEVPAQSVRNRAALPTTTTNCLHITTRCPNIFRFLIFILILIYITFAFYRRILTLATIFGMNLNLTSLLVRSSVIAYLGTKQEISSSKEGEDPGPDPDPDPDPEEGVILLILPTRYIARSFSVASALFERIVSS